MADVHEPARVSTALAQLGIDVVVRRLSIGDYELGAETLVERKTISDLRASLAEGGLWRQVGNLRSSRSAYFVVEGPDVLAAPRDANAVRGALLSIGDLGMTVIRSRDSHDTAAWLAAIAGRRAQQPIRRRSPHVGRPNSAPHTPQIRVLAAIDGVSEARATALLTRFGSVANVAAASKAELTKTPGVHATIAKRIHESLH